MVEYRFVLGIELYYIFPLGCYKSNIVENLSVDLLVIYIDILERRIEHIAEHSDNTAFFLKNKRRGFRLLSLGDSILPVLDKRLKFMIKFGHALAFGGCSDYDAEILRLDAFYELTQTHLFFRRFDFLGDRYFIVEWRKHQITAGKRYFSGEPRSFRRDRLFDNLHHQLAAGGEHIGHRAMLVYFRLDFHPRHRRQTFFILKKLGEEIRIS